MGLFGRETRVQEKSLKMGWGGDLEDHGGQPPPVATVRGSRERANDTERDRKRESVKEMHVATY